MKKILYTLLILSTTSLFAQQDGLFSQYMINPSNFNPGYTGSRGGNSLYLQHREQWVGMEGAPSSSFFNFQSYNDRSQLGYGLNIMRDNIGPLNETELSADLAYHMTLSDNAKLSLGIKGSFNTLNVDFSLLNQYQDDNAIYLNLDRKFKPNVGVGLYYYNDNSFFGLSIPYLLRTSHYDNNVNENSRAADEVHYYLMAGLVFRLSDNLLFKPTAFVRNVKGVPTQLDLSANFLISEKVQLGGTYRFSTAYSAMIGFQINPNILVGYSYDKETTALSDFNSGSHEMFLRYEFGLNRYKIQSPRFF